jgi:GNAT superfamily N-acetyltransferase
MIYDEIIVSNINCPEDYVQAWKVLSEEFPDHRDTNIIQQYEWIQIAKKSNDVIGVVTANKYIPKKALLCDIVVDKQYRSKGVGIKLLKGLGVQLLDQGYTHLVGFTPKKNKEALNTYKRVHTLQEEMIVTTSDLAVSRAHVEQMEMTLRAREERKKRNIKEGK